MKLVAEDEIKKTEENVVVRRSRRKKRGKQRLLAMSACLVVMVAVMFLTASVCVWVADRIKEKENAAPAFGEAEENITNYVDIDKDGNVLDASGNVLGVLSGSLGYSQAELDSQVLGAREGAVEEILEIIRGGLMALDPGQSEAGWTPGTVCWKRCVRFIPMT